MGLLHATLDEREEALRYAAHLRQLAQVSDTLGLIDDAARDVQAMVALSSGDTEGAVTILQGAALKASPNDHRRSFLYARSLHRMLRADALARLARYQEAIGWYTIPSVPLLPDKNYIAVSRYQRAEILTQAGDSARAIEHYSKFIDMWTEADPDRQARVAAARQRITQLRGDRTKD
jgi:tetratricopeptide (TPR) repeat protein